MQAIMTNRMLPFAIAALLAAFSGSGRLVAQDKYEPKPIPAGPEAYTKQRYVADKARFWRDVLLAECKVGDALRKEWQPHVEEMMTRYSEFLSASVPGQDRIGPVLEAGDRLQQLGCKDPVVQLVMADMLRRRGKPDAARDLYEAAAKDLGDRRLAASFEYLRQNCLAALYLTAKETERHRQAIALRDDCFVELAAAPEVEGGNERFYLEWVLSNWKDSVGPNELPMLERMEKRAGKPNYTLLVLRAMYHKKQAWAARGQSAASAVSRDEWEVFNRHIRAAAEAAGQASQLCPQHPEAPTMMLETLGPAGAKPAELRQWLDRAVAAQFDRTEAYMSYLHYLQPRWGGSQRALEKFGLECLATARFDTLVPELYRNAIQYITLDARNPNTVWARESVQQRLEELDAGYLAAAPDDHAVRFYKSRRIAALAIDGRAKEAAAICEQIGHSLDAGALEIFDVTEQWVMKGLREHFVDYQPAKIAPGDALLADFERAPYLGVAKARPMTAHENAITDEQYEAGWAKWFSAAFEQAYERAGTKDAAWDEDARALLADMGSLVTGRRPPGSLQRAERLLKAGCKDPLTLYAVARALDRDDARGMKTLMAAMEDLGERQPPIFSLWAEQHLVDRLQASQPGAGGGLIPQIREHMLAAATDPVFAGDNRRHYVRCLWGDGEFAKKGNDWVNDKMVAALASMKGVDPWIVHVVTGLHLARLGKHPTGSPAERRAHLKLATEHLQAAHELCPQFPEAAVGMIVVASIEQVGLSPREWFDRALDAQIDFEPAYRAYVDSLRPLYYGSIKAMYRFAVECLDSGRFDTAVPLWYVLTMQRIQEEIEVPRSLWASAGVAERLERMFRGYESRSRKVFDASYLHTARCVLAWAGGRYEDALGAWNAGERKLDRRFLSRFGGDADLIAFDLQFLAARRTK